jgi:hypothetical protein
MAKASATPAERSPASVPVVNTQIHALDYSLLKWSALFILVCLLLTARFPDPLTKPYALIFEEGSVYFQDAYNLPFWQAIFTPYAGYLNILTRLMAAACVWLPYESLPFAYSLLSLFSAAAVSSFFYLPAFRHVVPRDWQRFAICLGVCAASCAYPLLRLETVHFFLAIFLALVAIMKLPVGLLGKLTVAFVACLSVWSAPSAIVLGPCFLYRAAKKGTSYADRAVWSLITASCAGFIVSIRVLNKQSVPMNLDGAFKAYLHAFAYRVGAAGLAGEKAADRLLSAFGWDGVLPFLLLVGVLGFIGIKTARCLGYSLFPDLTLLWVICTTLILIALRPNIAEHFVSFLPGYSYWFDDRYFLPAAFLLLLYVGMIWSRLRGRISMLANILGPCWLVYMYLWGYTFHPWTDWGPKFADYGKSIRRTEREAAADGKIHKLIVPIAPSLWFAVLDVGRVKGTQQAVVPAKAKFTDFFDLDEGAERPGLRHSKWFGTFDDSQYPRIHHQVYGWMTCLEVPSLGGLWFWSEQEGSFWVHPANFPRVTSPRTGGWITLTPQLGQ